LTLTSPLERSRFRRTLRSCLGGDSCEGHVPSKKRSRVALLALPTSATARALWTLVRRYSSRDVDFVLGAHAPAYGYGKTHGFAKIVRLSMPLALENSSALVRQAVRWHCRVSHVAAHTALLTVDDTELLADPRRALERLFFFVGVKLVDRRFLDRMESHYADLVAPALKADLRRIASSSSSSEIMDAALGEELAATNELRDWPCQTLWVEDDEKGGRVPFEVRQRAPLLAPNCSAPYVTCAVPRDNCEQSGTCGPLQKPKRGGGGGAKNNGGGGRRRIK